MTTPRQLPATRTRVTPGEVLSALDAAWDELHKTGTIAEGPTADGLLVLGAHWHLETGGGQSMWNFNLGNAKSIPGDGRSWTFYRCNEIIDGKEVWFDPPHPQTRFRAFESLVDGALDYVALLYKRFTKAWATLAGGDPEAFAHELKAQRYYTASEALYVRVILERYVIMAWGFNLHSEGDQAKALSMLGFESVATFQAATNLKPDGIVGPLTMTELARSLRRDALARRSR